VVPRTLYVDEDPSAGVSRTKYRRAAADAVTDLSNFGGDNTRIAIAQSGNSRSPLFSWMDAEGTDIIPLLIKQLEVEDYPLQHSVMEALYTLSAHTVALTTIVNSNAIPILCRFLHDGLENDRLGIEHGRRGRPARPHLSCLTRKRGATHLQIQVYGVEWFSGYDVDVSGGDRPGSDSGDRVQSGPAAGVLCGSPAKHCSLAVGRVGWRLQPLQRCPDCSRCSCPGKPLIKAT